MPSQQRSILITGCSSGIGYTCALGMAERGWRVIATARKPDDLAMLAKAGLEPVSLDYTEPDSIAACAHHVLEATGGKLDVLFNNGAYGQPGAVEDLPVATLRAQFEANVFGWHDLTCRIIPAMRARKSGRIVQCSSVLGLVALKWRGAYNASKFAIEALSDTMRLELDGSGIYVSQIEPGPVRSRFRENAVAMLRIHVDMENSPHAAEYASQLAVHDKKFGRQGSAPLETPDQARASAPAWFRPAYRLGPDAVLDKLIHASESPNPKPQYYVTSSTTVMATARRILPKRLLDRLSHRVS